MRALAQRPPVVAAFVGLAILGLFFGGGLTQLFAPATTPPPPSSRPPSLIETCQVHADPGTAVPLAKQPARLAIVVRIDSGLSTTLLLAGPVSADPGLIDLELCRVTRGSAGDIVTASIGTYPAAPDPVLSFDQASRAAGEQIIAGRIAATVSRVEVTLASGDSLDATLGVGYYLAWWHTADDPVRIRAFDAAGPLGPGIEDAQGLTPPAP